MRSLCILSSTLLAAAPVVAGSRHNNHQVPVRIHGTIEKGIGHFSEWSRATKREFLIDWQAGKESEWTLVQGNEGGDLDSMTAALTWAYHLEHSTQNTSDPIKAIALLQTPTDALDLRPENQLALKNSLMTSGHEDLLTLDELPEDPETLSLKLRGIVLVDHAEPLRKWSKAKILSIFDHHVDRGAGPDAEPRVFETTASCTTLVARQMLDELEKLEEEYHMPHELLELILGAIAIDSSGLDEDSASEADLETSKRVLKRSNWAKNDLYKVMEGLNDALSKAKKDLDHLGLRDLLRRDYKGDLVDTVSPSTPTVSLGFASISYSMDAQIDKTEFQELFDWFAIHAAWTAGAGVDVSVTLNNYKTRENGKKKKIREIALVVRDDVRIDQDQADSLFKVIYDALTTNSSISLTPWHRVSELAPRQMVWTHESDAGRKVIRPIVEDAVMAWT
ncbi:DHH phosphoesterase [Pleomassaria siparia CBS 279.74]|uniref:DHH phosphoesterase n=1 Tax=Pleomassaria siparia CBS 279.74 TaxID=1314801 RepID=A0A6G1KAE9_9PLEO|nr:DHH phosphoesterase [Pleomassaria siparia CBS 279.74]